MTEIPTLWPIDKVSVDIVSPLAIIKKQANAITNITEGLLVGRVQSSETDDLQTHRLLLEAPVIDVVYGIIEASHAKYKPYPVLLRGAGLGPEGSRASTEAGFLELLTYALGSNEVLILINSAIAQSNERDYEEPNGSPATGAVETLVPTASS